MLTLPQLPLARFLFEFGFKGQNQLPAYSGSAWRGAFGLALKQTVCVVRHTACQDCLLRHSCVYPYVFETPPPPNTEKLRLYQAAPHPFVINTTQHPSDGQRIQLGLTLFGHGLRHLPYFIHALEKAGKQGLGKRHQPFELISVSNRPANQPAQIIYSDEKRLQAVPPEAIIIPDCPTHLRIHLESPLRLKQDNQNCNASRFAFGTFFGHLLRRISLLTYFHTDHPLETEFAHLTAAAKNVTVSEAQLAWQDWTRYSSRQQTTMNMGGLMGSFAVQGDLQPFWPYLWLGQWTHVGKGTSMGLGAYRIEAASLPRFPT